MQITIAVCDNNEKELQKLIRILNAVCLETNIPAEIYSFHSVRAFLNASASCNFTIAFMDIPIDSMSSIKAARSISKRQDCRFVFTAVSTEHAVEAFALNAAHYLLKPLTKESVSEALRRCIPPDFANPEKVVEIKFNNVLLPIPAEKILYIEVRNKHCTIHTETDCFVTRTSLRALYENLDSNLFIRAQQSFAVNMSFIDSFFYDRIVLRNGKEISLSRNNRAKLKALYQRFLAQLARSEKLQ